MIKLIKWFLAFLFFKVKKKKTNDLIDEALEKSKELKHQNTKYLQKFQTKKRYRKCPALKPY